MRGRQLAEMAQDIFGGEDHCVDFAEMLITTPFHYNFHNTCR